MPNSHGTCAFILMIPGELSMVFQKEHSKLRLTIECFRYHTISSLGPDSGNAVAISEDYNCDNPGWAVFYPGDVSSRSKSPKGRLTISRVTSVTLDGMIGLARL